MLDAPTKMDVRALLQRVAEVGPGFRGRRRSATAAEREALGSHMEAAGLPPPAYLDQPTEWIERSAKLFEAGDYPDKGVTVSQDDLKALAATFEQPVPVLIEHAESPLDLGFLTSVEIRGSELFGTVALTKEADQLVQRSGAKSLSLGLEPDLRAIREVSLVRNPRVPDARLFAALHFHGELREVEDPLDFRQEFERLREKQASEEAERQVREWMRGGRLTPAQAPFAQALLRIGGAVEFNGSTRSVRQLVFALFERAAPHAMFHEIVPAANGEANDNLMLPEEAEFYRRHFPDISLPEIAARR